MVVVAPFDRAASPPGTVTVTAAPGAACAGGSDGGSAGGRTAGLGQPGAALPGADGQRLGDVAWAIVMLARSGKIGWFSSSGPKRSSS